MGTVAVALKISFWAPNLAPIINQGTQPEKRSMMSLTSHESHFCIVRWRFRLPRLVRSRHLDIIAFELVVKHHLENTEVSPVLNVYGSRMERDIPTLLPPHIDSGFLHTRPARSHGRRGDLLYFLSHCT